mmetsp:Transcript_48026/g.153593  ORF Transcript_48026/g.153593 Transcript_48026/m.153593 type:complete len:329 (+) Transcript_48026:1-987(+)
MEFQVPSTHSRGSTQEAHMIASYADGSVCIFDATTATKHSQPPLSAGAAVCLAGLECGPRLLFGHARGELSSIALPAFELSAAWKALVGCKVRCLCAAGQDGMFLLGAENGELQLWQRRDEWVQAGAAASPDACSASAGAVASGTPEEGAPRCTGGHLCLVSHAGGSSVGPRGVWRCAICTARRKDERWCCAPCAESFCFECFPRRSAGKASDRKEAVSVDGSWVHVRKHSSMGCAVVTFKDSSHRDPVLARFALGQPPLVLGGVLVELKPHWEKQPNGSREEVPECAFAGWKQPKDAIACRLGARPLQACLERICASLCPVVALDED